MFQLDLLLAFLGGVLPALIWLFFWLMEDRCEPEPKRFIFYSFVAGMCAVAPALFFEWHAKLYFTGTGLLLSWALIEEVVKFGAAYLVALRFYVYDEPLDAVVYLVTAALGFSALENALFLWTPISAGDALRSVVTGDLRFMGASMLHCLTSATVGLSLAFAFYKSPGERRFAAATGLILAIALHTLFNFFILNDGSETLWVFVSIWFGTIALLLMTERTKLSKDYC